MKYIRPWRLSDASDLAEAANNKNVLKNLRDGIPFPYTEKDGEDFISAMLRADKESSFPFAVVHNGKAVGSIGVFRMDNIHRRTAELGYYIAQPYWGQGITTGAVKEICGYVFQNTDIIRIFAEPFSHNLASCRVLEKAGFQFEGTLRQNAEKDGEILDMNMYSILKNN